MTTRADFFRSLSFLCHCGAIYTLRFILEESAFCEQGRRCSTCDRAYGRRHLLLILDCQGTVLEIAPHIAARLGYSSYELCGQNFFTALPAAMRMHQWPIYCEVIRTGEAIRFLEQGVRGHEYDALFMPVALDGQVQYVLGLATEERQFTEVLPDGTQQQL